MTSNNISNSSIPYQMPSECCRCVLRLGNDYVRVDRVIDVTGTPFVGAATYQELRAPLCTECLGELRALAREAAKHQRKLCYKILIIALGAYLAAWIFRLAAPSLSFLIVAIGTPALIVTFVCIVVAALASTKQLRGYKDRLAFWDSKSQRVVFQNPEYQAVFDRLNGLT